jgi:hypothetical protein
MKTWKNSPQNLLIIHNQQLFSLPAWLPKRPVLGRNRNFIGSPCLLSTISLSKTDILLSITDVGSKVDSFQKRNQKVFVVLCAFVSWPGFEVLRNWKDYQITGNILIQIDFFIKGSHMTKIWYLIWMYVQSTVQCYFKVKVNQKDCREETRRAY